MSSNGNSKLKKELPDRINKDQKVTLVNIGYRHFIRMPGKQHDKGPWMTFTDCSSPRYPSSVCLNDLRVFKYIADPIVTI